MTDIVPTINTGSRGLVITNLDEMWRMAGIVHKSGLAPSSLKSQEQLFVAAQHGAELGLSFMQAIQGIAVINGKPCLYGDTFMAVIRAHPLFDDGAYEEWFTGTPGKDDYTARCAMGRRGSERVHERSFSVAQAKKAGLWGKSGPWTQYPDRQMMWRARTYCGRDVFADALKGLSAAEEVIDYTAIEAEPRQVIRRPQRRTVEPTPFDAESSIPIDPAPADPVPEPAPDDKPGEVTTEMIVEAWRLLGPTTARAALAEDMGLPKGKLTEKDLDGWSREDLDKLWERIGAISA